MLRFGLIALSNSDDVRKIISTEIDDITKAIRNETKSISQFLDILENSSATGKLQKSVEIQKISSELREIRSESVRISSKMLALAFHGQQLDDLISEFCISTTNERTDEIIEKLNKMKSEISLSHDELERILILFQKYLNIELDSDEGKIPSEKIENQHNALNNNEKITDDYFPQPTDEFFFVDGKQNDCEEEIKNREDEIDEIDSKLAKKYFKPVLVQLRERIEIIGEDFKEREKKVLQAKGIDIDGIIEGNDMEIRQSDEDSDSDDEREKQKRIRKNAEKFRENREFLESKQQFNVFKLPPPVRLLNLNNLEEDVIE